MGLLVIDMLVNGNLKVTKEVPSRRNRSRINLCQKALYVFVLVVGIGDNVNAVRAKPLEKGIEEPAFKQLMQMY